MVLHSFPMALWPLSNTDEGEYELEVKSKISQRKKPCSAANVFKVSIKMIIKYYFDICLLNLILIQPKLVIKEETSSTRCPALNFNLIWSLLNCLGNLFPDSWVLLN